MSFKSIDIKMEYRTLLDNMAKEFYVPLLSESISYKRAVGYFSSTVLVDISKGIVNLAKNNGKIMLITSPNLSEEDITAIRQGYANRDDVICRAIRRGFLTPENEYQKNRLNLLANLIADGILDIRIAVTMNARSIGIYHEKVGIIEDFEGNKIAFSGSMNETLNALCVNYETVDVFCDWSGDRERVKKKENAFDSIWNKCEPNIRTYEFPELTDEFIRKYKTSDIKYEEFDDSQDIVPNIEKELSFFKVPDTVEFFDYQKDAISNWIRKSCCGIYDMATGTGKTYTALGSICHLSQILDEKLAVVIVAPYQHLVEQWVEDINFFNVKPIVAYSYKGQNWRNEFSNAVSAYNVKAIDHFCIIATNATFSGEDFQNILKRFRRNFCFVVDEAHNFGAEKISKLLPKKARYRLALSATIERYRDKKGTEVLYNYFGKEPCITFTLKDAIRRGFLTPYYYHPVVVYLSGDELEEYNDLTKQITKLGYQYGQMVEKNSYLELLLIRRARIIAGCKDKVSVLIDTMQPFKNDDHILVYCGATKYDRNDISDDSQIKQIEEVNRQLYESLGMRVRKFTSSEDNVERAEIKQLFLTERIQVITAIKCLDEGVNIPAINKAFILASSTNPKEYIQRRGRVLRKAEGKQYAEIYDFITLPRRLETVRYLNAEEKKMDLSLVRREFERMTDFADTAKNPSAIDELKQRILDAYGL